MGRPAAASLPTSATAGQLAEVVGASERVIRGRLADGRLPRGADGALDLRRVIHAGVDALSEDQRQRARDGTTEREAREAGFKLERMAVWLTIREAPATIAREAIAAGLSLEQAKALHERLVKALPDLANHVLVEHLDTPHDPEAGPLPALDRSCEPDWTSLTATQKPRRTK